MRRMAGYFRPLESVRLEYAETKIEPAQERVRVSQALGKSQFG
jgi:hypothetical protein